MKIIPTLIFALLALKVSCQEFNNPEELFYDEKSDAFFVSNTLNGQIIKVAKTGERSKIGYKGLGSHGIERWQNNLLVLKGNQIRVIDLATERLVKTLQIQEGKFLKDIVQIDPQCYIISDFSAKKLFKLKFYGNGSYETSEWKSMSMTPTGLYTIGNDLFVCHWGSEGAISRIDLRDKSIKNVFVFEKSNLVNIAADDEFLYINAWKENEIIKFKKDFSGEPIYFENPSVLHPGGLFYDQKQDELLMTDIGLNRFEGYKHSLAVKDESKIQLHAFPNPVAYNSRISYHLDHDGEVIIQLYNCKGQLLKTVQQKFENSGQQQFILEKENFKDGLYFLQVTSNNQSEAIPLTFVH